VNEKIKGIIIGAIIALFLMIVGASLFICFVYYAQPEFVCELCKPNCSMQDFLIIKP